VNAASSFSRGRFAFAKLSNTAFAIALRCSWRQIKLYKAGTREIKRDVMDHLAYIVRHGLLPEVSIAIRERCDRDRRARSNGTPEPLE